MRRSGGGGIVFYYKHLKNAQIVIEYHKGEENEKRLYHRRERQMF